MGLAQIDTIVIAIMENRSFDHMLGYLSLDETPARMPVEGLRSDPAWRAAYANESGGIAHQVEHMPAAQPIADPPHEHASIAMQIDFPPAGPGPTGMGGFVHSYFSFSDPTPSNLDAVMGYYDGSDVASFDFFARHFRVCDNWFSPLPLGTQANRLMAMSGESRVFDNRVILPPQPLVYDWLTERGIRWCTYVSGGAFPFFTLMLKWTGEIAASLTLSGLGRPSGHFRRYKRFGKEWRAGIAPEVIFIEPQYTDGPGRHKNDDHPPTGVEPGQKLLLDLYRTLVSHPERWAGTLLIVTYDEHGGFFDHRPPLPIEGEADGVPLHTTGVRVPALLISPHVESGSVFSEPLDHSSILQLLDDRFGDGQGYSDAVERRSRELGRIADALLPKARSGPAPMLRSPMLVVLLAVVRTFVAWLTEAFGRVPGAAAEPARPTVNAVAMDQAARRLAREYPELLAQPGWEEVREYLRRNPVPLAERLPARI